MLAVFSGEVVGVPAELVAAGSRTPSPKTRASELVSRFLGSAEPAVSMQLGSLGHLAYSHANQSLLRPRYEPQSYLLGSEYFLHAYGPIYALSADVVASLVALRNNSFRMFSNEDVTIGSWMLAMDVNHENTHALCEPDCTESSIAVWDIPKCSGLCHPEVKMLELHRRKECTGGPAEVSESDDR